MPEETDNKKHTKDFTQQYSEPKMRWEIERTLIDRFTTSDAATQCNIVDGPKLIKFKKTPQP